MTCQQKFVLSVVFNYETVSTDYDMCYRLYFDELSFEVGVQYMIIQGSFMFYFSNCQSLREFQFYREQQ